MEQTTITEQNQAVSTAAPETSSNAPVQTEKMVPQSKVDEIVRHSNANVAQKARQQALEEFQRQMQSTVVPMQSSQTLGGIQPSPDIDGMVAQKVEQKFSELQNQISRAQQEEYGNKLAADFNARLEATKANYADFDTVTQGVPFAKLPHTILTAMNFDNTGDIVYELSSNPQKLSNMENLARFDAECARDGIQSNLAFREMQKMSEALRINKAAQNVKTPNSPLSQVQPSPTETDNGPKKTKDFRLMYLKQGH